MPFGRYIQVSFNSVRYRKRTPSEFELVSGLAMIPSLRTVTDKDGSIAKSIASETINSDSFFYTGTNTLNLPSELHTTIDVKTDDDGLSGRIRIRNLSPDSINFITELPDRNHTHELFVIVNAGYKKENQHGQMIRASVASVNVFTSDNDVITEVILKDKSMPYAYETISISESNLGAISVLGLVKSMLTRYGIMFVDEITPHIGTERGHGRFLGENTTIHNSYSYYGNINNFVLENLGRINFEKPSQFEYVKNKTSSSYVMNTFDRVKVSCTAYYDMNGLLHLCWDDLLSAAPPMLISESTGLLELPRQSPSTDEMKLKVRHMLLPQFDKGRRVLLNSVDKSKNGVYTISDMKIKGDNYSGNHYAELTLIK